LILCTKWFPLSPRIYLFFFLKNLLFYNPPRIIDSDNFPHLGKQILFVLPWDFPLGTLLILAGTWSGMMPMR